MNMNETQSQCYCVTAGQSLLVLDPLEPHHRLLVSSVVRVLLVRRLKDRTEILLDSDHISLQMSSISSVSSLKGSTLKFLLKFLLLTSKCGFAQNVPPGGPVEFWVFWRCEAGNREAAQSFTSPNHLASSSSGIV